MMIPTPLFYYHNISYWSNGDTQSFMGGGIHVSYIKGAYVEFYLKRATYLNLFCQQNGYRNTKLNYYLDGNYLNKRDISPTKTSSYPELIGSLAVSSSEDSKGYSLVKIENAYTYEMAFDYITTDGVLVSKTKCFAHYAFSPYTDLIYSIK